jgi:hypothetical protein
MSENNGSSSNQEDGERHVLLHFRDELGPAPQNFALDDNAENNSIFNTRNSRLLAQILLNEQYLRSMAVYMDRARRIVTETRRRRRLLLSDYLRLNQTNHRTERPLQDVTNFSRGVNHLSTYQLIVDERHVDHVTFSINQAQVVCTRSSNQDYVCCCCREVFEELREQNKSMLVTPCSHEICQRCMEDLFRSRAPVNPTIQCPICRRLLIDFR